MKRKLNAARVMITLALLVSASVALAGSVAYELPWFTVDGGGGMWSAGGGFTLGGTIGQPDAGLLSGGDYTLSGGFWGADALRYLYLPVVMR